MGLFKKKTDEQIERETKIYLEKEKKRQAFIKAKNERAEKIRKLKELKSKNTKSGRFFSGVGKVADSIYSGINENKTSAQNVRYVSRKKPKKKRRSQRVVYVEKKPKRKNPVNSLEEFERKLQKVL